MAKSIMQHFEKTFDDKRITSSERKALIKILNDYAPTNHQMNLLRSKIFKLAQNNTSGAKNAQVINWLEDAVKILNSAKPREEVKNNVYFSPGTECLEAILAELGSAFSTIDICVFTISDNRIADKLKYCKMKGVKIRLLTDDEKTFDLGSDIEELARSGISVRIDRTRHHMHHKFCVVDNKRVITGSYNWTRSAEQYNHENVLITNDKKVVDAYCNEFEKLWKDMKPF